MAGNSAMALPSKNSDEPITKIRPMIQFVTRGLPWRHAFIFPTAAMPEQALAVVAGKPEMRPAILFIAAQRHERPCAARFFKHFLFSWSGGARSSLCRHNTERVKGYASFGSDRRPFGLKSIAGLAGPGAEAGSGAVSVPQLTSTMTMPNRVRIVLDVA